MISIKHRFTRAILCEFDVETIKHAAENGRADLCGANLCEADLREADLRGAVIECEKITKTPIQIPIGLTYVALITNGFMRLGCKRYSHAEWAEFSDDQISEMDSEALEFWKVWKAPLLAMCAAHAGESK